MKRRTDGDRAAPRSLFRRILAEVRPWWVRISALLVVELLATPLLLLTPIPLKIAVDSVIGHKPVPAFISAVTPSWFLESSEHILILAALLQIVVVVLSDLQDLVSYVLQTQTGERMTLAFRARLFRHIQRLSILFHDTRGTADSVYRVQYDAPALQFVTTDGVVPFFTSIVTLLVTLWVVARLDWQLCLVALAICPALYVLARLYNRRMRPRYKAVKGTDSDAMGVVQEVLTSLRVVKVFGREDREQERFVSWSRRGAEARIRLAFAEGLFGLLINATTAVGTAAVLYIGVRNVESGALTLGELLMIIAYLAQLYSPLKTISRKVASLQTQLASAERAFEVLDEPAEVPEDPHPVPLARADGHVEFRNVSFCYQPGHRVLSDLSFLIEPGARVGVAGRTGAGKTTMLALLTRFFDPTEGAVLLDGVDVRRYALADLRRQFAVVPQDPVLFSTNIGENISYARPDTTVEEVVAAARSANAHDFICRLPDGYDTPVGERGMRLSGGERQRIALARAFLKDAPILLLDEPTSSIDTRTEATIMETMHELMEGRTTFMIAHRLSTLDVCDIRFEIDGGRMIAATR